MEETRTVAGRPQPFHARRPTLRAQRAPNDWNKYAFTEAVNLTDHKAAL